MIHEWTRDTFLLFGKNGHSAGLIRKALNLGSWARTLEYFTLIHSSCLKFKLKQSCPFHPATTLACVWVPERDNPVYIFVLFSSFHFQTNFFQS